MKNPFIFSIRRKISGISTEALLTRFKTNFEHSNCDSVKIIGDNRLIVRNYWPFIKYDLNYNIWIGIAKASVSIVDDTEGQHKNVQYTVNYTKGVVGDIVISAVLIAISISVKEAFGEFIYFVSFIIFIFVLDNLTSYYRHKSFFIRTLYNKNTDDLGKYDWDKILRNKSDLELKEIIFGKTHLPISVAKLAKQELDRRENKDKQ